MYSQYKYSHSSLAEQQRQTVTEESAKLRAIRVRRHHKKSNRRRIIAISFIAVMLGFCVYRSSYITELNYSVEQAKYELNTISNQNSLLRVDIEKNLNLNAIRREAKKKYKMQNPKENQKVYLKIERKDISVADCAAE